jgi:hypothetical protein
MKTKPLIENSETWLTVKAAFIDGKEMGDDKESVRLEMIRAGCPISSSSRLYGIFCRDLGYEENTKKPVENPSQNLGRSSLLARSIYDWMEQNPTAHRQNLINFLDSGYPDSVRRNKRQWLRIHELVARVHQNAGGQ